MRTFNSLITLAFVSATLVYAAKRIPLTAASIVPAAKGSVNVGKDRNGNTNLKLTVEHLAKPENLSPPQTSYIVWFQSQGGDPESQGELKLNGKLIGSLQAMTPRKHFELFITGENDVTVKSPSGPEVLRATISR